MSVESAGSGFIAGFLAGILQKYVWAWFQSPNLEIGEDVQKVRKSAEDEDSGRKFVNTVFRVPVDNTGKSAAYNCKPLLTLEGKAPLPRWVPNSAIQTAEGTEAHGGEFKVKTELVWAESGNPSRVTINRGSTAYFNLILIQGLQEYDEPTEQALEMVAFPSESGWGGESPVDIVNQVFEHGIPRPADGSFRLNRDQITRADYSESHVDVTAENTKKATANLRFYNDSGWPAVDVES